MAVTKHQNAPIELVWRSSIREHPQNPRRITDEAKKKLKGKIQEVGLIGHPVINRTTGHLLSGHQRLSSIDSLERYKDGKNDYQIEVIVVEIDEQKELEMLVFFNNHSAQGSWDTDILANLGREVSFESMGFDSVDVELMFDGSPDFGSMFQDNGVVSETKGVLEEIKADREKMKKDKTKEQSVDYYVTVVCKDQEEKERLMKHLGIPKGELYISPHEIFSLKRK